jgi:NADPH:quinone reductase-like Zn-dependent oxidoreductase
VVGAPKSAVGTDVQVHEVWSGADAHRLEQLAQEIASGEFSIPIAKRFTLAEIRQAHEVAEKGVAGKILLTP